jgi:23S rRNA (uracil1939-C5)-methyltransferase
LNLEPGAGATPPCPHFGPCGGCQLQHLAYPAQLALKANRLRALLAATGLPLPQLQLHASPPLAYRNRIRLTLDLVDGQLRAGYIGNSRDDDQGDDQPNTRQHGATFLPITQCPIAAPALWRTAETFVALLNQDPALWLRSPWFTLDQLELFTTPDESRIQLSLHLRTSGKSLPGSLGPLFTLLSEALRAHIPALTGAGVYMLPPYSPLRSRRAEQPRPGPTWGSPGLNYTIPILDDSPAHDEAVTIAPHDEAVILSAAQNLSISPLPLPAPQRTTNNQQLTTVFWVPRTAFFQVNRFLLPELLSLVSPDPVASNTGELAWDLYAGVGLFTRALAPHFARITAVEIAEPAFTALAQTKLPNLHAVKATTLDFLRAAVLQRDRPGLVVLDPPRTGAGREVCELLARIAAPTLIYVSCSPESLPADLATLAASGYAVAQLHLFDLFPQTTHIETVAILTH